MILTAVALLKDKPHPTEEEIKEYMRGNLCRCTGYIQIVKAIQACAAEQNKKNQHDKIASVVVSRRCQDD